MSDALDALLELITPPEDIERVDDWIFTFGTAHRHPETGAPLKDKYIRIRGTWGEARELMLAMFSNKWSHQSSSDKAAEYERKYGTTELSKDEWPKSRTVT